MQIRNAILETAYLGVLNAYMMCKRPSFLGGIRSGMQRLSGRSLQKALSQEVEQFGMVQKTEYGFDLLDTMGKRVLKLIGVTADLWILPEGMKMYLNTVRKENFQSPNAGAMGAIAPVGTRAPTKPTDVAVDVAYNCQVVETKSFELPSMSEPLNPMERPATIGEYYLMFNHLRGSAKPAEYRSAWRDIFLYNEDKDGFTRITLDAALRNCSRFDADGDLINPNLGGGGGGDGVPPDMFYRLRDTDESGTDTWRTTEHMGDMHKAYLRDGGLDDWTDSVVAKIVAADPSMARALRDGLELCARIDRSDSVEGAAETWLVWLYMVHIMPRLSTQWSEQHGLPYPPTCEEVAANRSTMVHTHTHDDVMVKVAEMETDGAFRALDERTKYARANAALIGDKAMTDPERRPYWVVLCEGVGGHYAPLMEGGSGEIKALPVGYASWPGMCILANPKYKVTFGEVHATAARFVTAFDTLYSELLAHTNASIFTNGDNAPPWVKSRDGRGTLFANLVYASQAPIWMTIPIKGDGKTLDLPEPPGGSWNAGNIGERFPQNVDSMAVDPNNAIKTYNEYVKPLVDNFNARFGRDDVVPKDMQASMGVGKHEYDACIQGVCKAIGLAIDKVRPADLPADTVTSLVERLIALFRKYDMTSGRVVMNDNYMMLNGPTADSKGVALGVFLAIILRDLTVKVLGMTYAKDETTYDTQYFTAASFVNMAAGAKNVRAFIMFLAAACTFIDDYDNKTVVQWRNDNDATGVLSLKKHIDNDIMTKAGVSYVKVQEYPDFAVETVPINNVTLPTESALYHSNTYILRTHLTGGAAMAAATKRWTGGTPQIIERYKVVIDPFGGDEHVFGVPPIFEAHKMDDHHPAKPTFGAKRMRRFGARDDERSVRARMTADADEGAYEYAEVMERNPWNVKESPGLLYVSSAFKGRFREVAIAETDLLRRVAKLAFLGQPATRATLSRIVASDDIFPFGFLLLRPYMTYAMASAILTVGGSRTGETLVGHADFQLGDNIVQKMHIGNFTMYLKSIVYQPQHVWIAENVMACGYIGGNNCEFRRWDAPTDPPALASDPSLFACLIPYDCTQEGGEQPWESEIPNPLDITGDYASGNPALSALRTSVRKLHYASALFYRHKFGWDNGDQNMSDDSLGTSNRYNTLTFAGHYAMYNPQSQRYDLVHENTGHRGNRIYQGCGRVWRGLAKLLEPVNYTSQHGGAPVRSLVTNAV